MTSLFENLIAMAIFVSFGLIIVGIIWQIAAWAIRRTRGE